MSNEQTKTQGNSGPNQEKHDKDPADKNSDAKQQSQKTPEKSEPGNQQK